MPRRDLRRFRAICRLGDSPSRLRLLDAAMALVERRGITLIGLGVTNLDGRTTAGSWCCRCSPGVDVDGAPPPEDVGTRPAESRGRG